MNKICTDCNTVKPTKEFPRSKFSDDGRMKRCKSCHDSRIEAFTNYERYRNKNLFYLYGLELEDYNRILEEQGGLCKICREGQENEPLLVDHCHDSLKIRGLVCRDCNTGLARFKDSVEILSRAMNYLESDGERLIPKPISWRN